MKNNCIVRKGYCICNKDFDILELYRSTLRVDRTRSTYTNAVLEVCDHFEQPFSALTPENWTEFVNVIIPQKIIKREISLSTSRVWYYAIKGFLTIYGTCNPEFNSVIETFIEPAKAPAPKINKYPTAVQMSAILQSASEYDIQTYIICLLAYECALSTSEILSLQCSSFMEREDGVYVLKIPGHSKRVIEIREDMMQEIELYMMYSGYTDGPLFRNSTGGQLSDRSMQIRIRKMQQPLIDKKILLGPYGIDSMRSAAIHRMLISDRASASSAAQYAGIKEAYAARIKSAGCISAVQLPGTRHNITIAQLMDSNNTSQDDD